MKMLYRLRFSSLAGLLGGLPVARNRISRRRPPQQTTADTSGVADAGAAVDDTDAPAVRTGELLSKRIVYFDFDRADIRADSQAWWPRTRPISRRTLRRRCGSKAMPMSAARANTTSASASAAARRCAARLLLQGVAEAQLSTVSYGEERPAAAGSDEQAYALNRRVEIVYLQVIGAEVGHEHIAWSPCVARRCRWSAVPRRRKKTRCRSA